MSNSAEILEQLHTAVVVLDSTLRVTYLNHAAEALFEKSAQRIIGKEVRQLYVDPAEQVTVLRNTLDNGQPFTKRQAVLTSNGLGELRAPPRPASSQIPKGRCAGCAHLRQPLLRSS